MRITTVLLFFLLLLKPVSAQNVSVKGKVIDSETKQSLYFANIRVLGTSFGTTTNRQGDFELRLPAGNYKFAASFMGYFSDTLAVNTYTPVRGIIIELKPTNISFPEITVKPGVNPAIPIIRKAVERKMERDRMINNFEFEAYTKGVIKTTDDIKAGSNSVSLGGKKNDTTELKITGLLENQSRGYFQKPGLYKEVIIARKQSSNLPPAINTLTGGRIIQNFYDENINFFGRALPGPLASYSLAYYYFYIESKTSLDNRVVYKIHMAPENSTDPGFEGSIYIADSTFDLIKVDLMLNRSANSGGLLDSISIKQQFAEYDNSVYMPSNYSLGLRANPLGLLKLGFEITSILYDYKINQAIDPAIFNKAIVTVLPDADKKDSLYWSSQQVIPNTAEEQTAYKRIDSVESRPLTFSERFSFLADKIYFTKNFAVSAPLSLYHFNRVEGNSVDLSFYIDNAFQERFSSALSLSSGFSDRRFKTEFSASYLTGDYRTTSFTFNAYNRLNTLFAESDAYNNLTSTLLALISKDEFRDYYYSRGINFDISGELFPVLALTGGLFYRTDISAAKNTEFSLFARDRIYRDNPGIFDFNNMLGLKAAFTLDFRNYIEDGFYRRRISENGKYLTIQGEVSSPVIPGKFLNNEIYKFTRYEANITAGLRTFRSANLDVRIKGIVNSGFLPYQMLYVLPGNINLAAKRFTFRTLEVNEITGENVLTVNLEHNFKDELFKMLRIPGLKNSEIQLYTYINAAYSEIKNSNYKNPSYSQSAFQPVVSGQMLHPFYEAGFGLGHVLSPIQIEFTWKLNYRGNNNFRVGISSVVF